MDQKLSLIMTLLGFSLINKLTKEGKGVKASA